MRPAEDPVAEDILEIIRALFSVVAALGETVIVLDGVPRESRYELERRVRAAGRLIEEITDRYPPTAGGGSG